MKTSTGPLASESDASIQFCVTPADATTKSHMATCIYYQSSQFKHIIKCVYHIASKNHQNTSCANNYCFKNIADLLAQYYDYDQITGPNRLSDC